MIGQYVWTPAVRFSLFGTRRLHQLRSLDNKMNSFLKQAKQDLLTSKDRITIVVGNESCDLDSMSSAILYAWFRTHEPAKNAFSKTYVPLLNIPKEDIRLRPEFKTLFKQCDIDEDNLATRTDLTQAKDLKVESTQWALVDHNKLEGDLGSIYSKHVVGCIDHHEEENAIPVNQTSEPRVIEKCGSCTSLVLRELAKQLGSESRDLDDIPPYTTDALKLGLASILIDTNNLKDKNKVTKVDIDIAIAIDEILCHRDSTWNKEEFFNDINHAKKSLDGLPLNDILRKDYKQWTEGSIKLGMSSVVKDLRFLIKVNHNDKNPTDDAVSWKEATTKFMNDRGLDMWAVMTAYSEQAESGQEEFKRQLMIHWKDAQSAKLIEVFEQKYGADLKLELAGDDLMIASRGENWRIWQQGNVAASRKQVGPMLRNIMKQDSKI